MVRPTIAKADQIRVIHAFGEEIRIHLGAEQTGGLLAMFTELTPPGGGPPPHWHENEDEWFHVIEGTVSFLVEGQWTDAHPGDTVFAPRETVHTFKNNTSNVTRMVIQTSPAGFEKFFAEEAEEFAKPGGPDMQRVMQIADAYGIHFVQG
jgi:quercetin dioxygenase-like cupin family protein